MSVPGAPSVPSALSRPTVAPVSASTRSRSLTTPGGTADSTTAGRATAIPTSTTVPVGPVPRNPAPTPSTITIGLGTALLCPLSPAPNSSPIQSRTP